MIRPVQSRPAHPHGQLDMFVFPYEPGRSGKYPWPSPLLWYRTVDRPPFLRQLPARCAPPDQPPCLVAIADLMFALVLVASRDGTATGPPGPLGIALPGRAND